MNSLASCALAYFVNAIWQVPLVLGATALLARWVRGFSPVLEHRLWVGALMLEAFLPAVSMLPARYLRAVMGWLHWGGSAGAADGRSGVTVSFGEGSLRGGLGLPEGLLMAISVVYLAVVGFAMVQLLWNLWRTSALRPCVERAALDRGLDNRGLDSWAQEYRERFRVPEAEVAMSGEVCGPVTLGIRRRLLLLPPMWAELAEEDARAALAHEVAHMRRRDFAKNLLYRFVTVPIAFHPALRLTLARAAETREMICDGVAAEVVAGPARYARSLLRLASRFAHETPNAPLYAIGIFDAHTLERRLMTLTSERKELGRGQRLAIAMAAVMLTVGTFTSAMAMHTSVHQQEQQNGQVEGKTVRISSGVMAGNRLTQVPPVYPQEARDQKITGAVVLHAVIGKAGTVEQLSVISGPDILATAAIDAVRQWTYKPYFLNGEPTEVDTTITVNFQLAE